MGGAWARGWAAAHCCKPRHGFSPPRVGPRGAPEAGERGRLLVLEARQRAAGSGCSLTLRESSGVEVGALAPVTWQQGWPARPRLGAPAAQCPGRRPRRGSSPEPGASCGPLGAADSGAGADAGAAGESHRPSQFSSSFTAELEEPRALHPLRQPFSLFGPLNWSVVGAQLQTQLLWGDLRAEGRTQLADSWVWRASEF